jgi:hypothetical protein
MARVTGALHSDAASGTFAGSLTFSSWKGRAYVRNCVTPTNPKTAKQTGVRAMMGFLAAMWKAKVLPKWTGWTAAAAAGNFSTFNAFIQENLKRWQNFEAPTEVYPAAAASTALSITTQTLTGGKGQVTVSLTPSGGTSLWGYILCRDTTTVASPSWANCVAVIPANGANAITYVDTPLNAGTYHYVAIPFNIDGVLGTPHADGSATAT